MSLRRTPGVICQCQGGTPVDEGTLSLTTGGLPGPSGETIAGRLAAGAIYASVRNQTPVSMSWESIRAAAQVARDSELSAIASSAELSLSDAVYGFTVRQVAMQYLDVREVGQNRGSEVESFLDEVGRPGGDEWCAAFVSHCHYEAAAFLCADTTCTRQFRAVAMVFDGRDAANITFSKQSVLAGTHTPIAGDVFVMITRGSLSALDAGKPRGLYSGHTGLVASYDATTHTLTTIEGNSGPDGSKAGTGVFMRTDRMTDMAGAKKVLWGFMRPRIVW